MQSSRSSCPPNLTFRIQSAPVVTESPEEPSIAAERRIRSVLKSTVLGRRPLNRNVIPIDCDHGL